MICCSTDGFRSTSSPWRDSITTGRITRAFIDVFLGYWLTVQTGKDVSVEHLFSTFKRWLQQSRRVRCFGNQAATRRRRNLP